MKKGLLSIILMALAITFPTQSWAQNNIQFEDDAVKAICVANWDTNGDGELSYDEATAVTDIGTVFSNNSSIRLFHEFAFFTGLTQIPNDAFFWCVSLEEITLPQNITSIGNDAFYHDEKISSIILPDKLISIGSGAFGDCWILSITIPASVSSIEWAAFDSRFLESITVDNDNITYDSRNQCNAIIETASNKLIVGCKNSTIPEDIVTIGEYAFSGCSFEKNLHFPSSLRKIEYQAFYQVSGLTSLEFPEGLEEIADNAFQYCNLQSIVLPNSLTTLGSHCFESCNLTTIYIPASVTTIWEAPFCGNQNLSQIIVEEDNPRYDSRNECNAIIEKENYTLIQGCNTTVFPEEILSLGGYAFSGMNITTITIPEGITYLGGYYAFSGCNSLEEVTIPSSIIPNNGLGFNTFEFCFNIKTIRCYMKTPGHYQVLFPTEVTEQATLYVPYGTKSLYEAADGWSNFRNIVEMEKADNEPIVVNLINNGDMEGEDVSCFFTKINGGDINPSVITDGVGMDGSRGIKVETTDRSAYVWDNQFWVRTNQPISDGSLIRVSFDYRADQQARVNVETHAEPGSYIYGYMFDENMTFDTDWQHFTYESIVSNDKSSDQNPMHSIAFTLSQFEKANYYYYDNVKVEVILKDQCPKPTFTQNKNEVIIQSPFDATIYYTLDGSEPTTNSEHGTGTLVYMLSQNATIKAFAVVEGYEPSPVATYSFRYTKETEPIAVDLIINGDMEGEDNSSFYYRFLPESTKASPQAITDGVGVDGSRGIKIEASANQDEIYNDEFWFSLSQPVSEGTRFRLSYDARADHEATVYIGAHGPAFFGDFISDWMEPYATFGTEWQTFTMEGTISSDVSSDQKPLASLAFSLSVTPEANNYYFDNVKFEVYLEDQCPKPTFKQTNRGVIIQSPFNATIYYTYDGSTPTTNSEHNEYIVEQFLARSKFTIKAFAVVDGYEPSPVATYNYEYIENASFDRVTAWVSEGVSLDEVFEEVGGREEAAKTIAAIIWENDYPLTAEMLEGINNPNLLVYVNDASLAPQGVQNVVINGVAPEIILTDATTGNNSFFCPQQFRAEKISYTRNFRQHTVIGTSRGWEGLALPFAVQTVTHETQGQITPFRNDDSRKHFWLRQMTDRGLTNAQSIEPMVPYLIAMPNSAEYYDEFNLSGRVTFAAENVIMLETDYIGYGTGEIMLYPNFSVVDTTWEDVYALNVNDAREGWAEGSVFIRNYREVRPFEVYTMHLRNGTRPRYIPVNSQTNGNTTGINTIEADSANGTWYSIDGRQLQSEPKTKGVYINNGRKKVVSDLK